MFLRLLSIFQGQDLQFLVGVDGNVGRPMFEEVQGVTVTIKRPLRDLFKRLPEVETDVKVSCSRALGGPFWSVQQGV
jgi:hypothetical protein